MYTKWANQTEILINNRKNYFRPIKYLQIKDNQPMPIKEILKTSETTTT